MLPSKHVAACLLAVLSATLVAMTVDDRTLVVPLVAVVSCPLLIVLLVAYRERHHAVPHRPA